ncbi:MAG: S8 family serine peptidase, partial [Clostridia bacterium]|nr:S8 family serine peptidase [Clostridia bacterium]
MKRKTKRILCAALSTVMATSLIAESALHINAERTAAETKATESVSFTNATGKFDLSQITLANLNAKVVEAFDRNKSEKKTVIVSLKGDALLDTANGQSVPEYASTNAAQAVLEKIEEKQDAFLRRLTGSKIGYTLKHRYSVIDNALAIEVEESSVVSIKEMPEVETVVISQGYAVPKTLDVDPTSVGSAVSNSANANKTGIYNSAGYTDYSAGTVVAVLDTGLDYTHAAYQTPPPSATLALKQTGVQTLLDSKAFAAEDRTALGGNVLSASDVYVSDKVPFAYDYADDDPDVYPSYSNHGTHVAGIVAGQADSYTNKDGEIAKYQEGDVIPSGYAVGDPIPFTGVAPDAQLVICKVFTDDLDDEDLGGAVAEDILAALQDCVLLGVDVINMSLGTSAGFSAEGGDSEGDYLDSVYKSIQDAGISLICAASNDYSSAYGSAFGTNLTSNPDSGTVGSPSTFSAALSVASISGQKSEYFIANEGTDKEFAVYYLEANDKYNNPIDFFDGMLGESATGGELEYVVVPGTGLATNYTAQVKRLFNEKPYQRIALVKRGSNTFEEKVRIAMNNKAAGVIVYNNVAGEIRMSLGELESPVPSVSIDREAGEMMASVVTKSNRLGTIRLDRSLSAGPFMSDFSSWGPTPDLRLKPEITAHGGEITSTVPGGYGEQSGTSMASPNMAGFVALARSYIKQNMSAVLSEMTGSGLKEAVAINRLVNQLVMSTATTAYDEDGYPYSPRKQGAGLANIANVIGGTGAYLYTENADTDYRPKAELFDKLNEKDNIEVELYIHNFSSSSLTYEMQTLFKTEEVEKYDGFAVAEQAYMLDDNPAVWYIGDSTDAHTGDLTVAAGQKVKIRAVITLSDKEKEYFENFENGMYLEGFVKLISKTQGQCDMTLPFLGFYGDWSAAPMLDLTVYEVTADEKDASLKDEEKKKARVWATQPYASYYNEDYIIPMGSFVYLLPDEAEDMWTNEDYGAISRYNIYFGENEEGNYLTTTSLRAVYAGLLRNARTVNYTLENAVTGELIKESSINRVGKAYTAGSSGVPANVELKLAPEDYGLVSGGKYKMSFEFFLDYGDGSATDNLFEFTFYVDYEAPVLEDARVRYDNYKDGNKNKQKIFLEFDIYDNHYAQSLMLCYPDFQYNFETGEQEKVLKLATEYVTPVRNAKKNGITTVSIEVTDIYDKIKNEFYVQLDDYALNNSLFALQINSSNDQTATNVTPDDFALAEGEDQITVDVYGTHKVALVYEGKADLSNFHWRSLNPNAIGVKNGEIVGLRAGAKGRVVVSNGKGVEKYVNVTVSNTTLALDIPSISFSEMMSTDDWLTKAQGSVEVFADKEFTLNIVTDPWYYPVEDLDILWTSTNESIVTVTQEGVVNTLQKGTAMAYKDIK